MEYAQTVLVQIESGMMDEALRPQGLLAEIDGHRSYLLQQPGFLDLRVTRSVNAEGNVLVVVETRWASDTALIDYETREPNVASIIERHRDIVVPDSLQVLDMEAIRSAAEPRPLDAPTEASERLALPMLIPLGVLAFALLVIYGLSRVYLEVSTDVATPLAAGIAVGILVTAWIMASRPSIPGWQIASVLVLAAAVLTGGALFAVINDDDENATAEEPTATASPTPEGSPTPDGAPSGDLFEIAMIPTILFDVEELTLPAGTEITVKADNRDPGIPHNWAAYESRDAAEGGEDALALTPICSDCIEEVTFTTPAPGEYFFRCDVHPVQMIGTLIVE